MNVCRAEYAFGQWHFERDVAAQQSISGSDYKPEPAGSEMIDNVKSAQKWTPVCATFPIGGRICDRLIIVDL